MRTIFICLKKHFTGWIFHPGSLVILFSQVSLIQKFLAVWLVQSSVSLAQTSCSTLLLSYLADQTMETLISTFCSILKLCSYMQCIKTKHKDEGI